MDVARLDTMVTVVDAYNFLRTMKSDQSLHEQGLGANETDTRSITDLLVDQIEFADVLLLNKADLTSSTELAQVEAVLCHMNPNARVMCIEHGQVPLQEVFNTRRFDFRQAADSPGWLQEARGEHVPETKEYGIGNFVYRAHRPFHPQRLVDILREDRLNGVIRSKGFIWLATRHNFVNSWSQAGPIVNIEMMGTWWIQSPREQWPADPRFRAELEALIQDRPYGDRRQELVFIGMAMNQARLCELLDAALLTDEEMDQGPALWRMFTDPFPSIAELEQAGAFHVHTDEEHEKTHEHHHHMKEK